MFPGPTFSNSCYSVTVNSESFRQHYWSVAKFENFLNLFFSKFGRSVFLTLLRRAKSPSAFCHHVVSVLLRRSEKQMDWPHARRVVALVTNKQSVAYSSAEQFVGKSMSRKLISSAVEKQSVSSGGFGASPLPTPVPDYQRFQKMADLRAVERAHMLSQKRLATSSAKSFNFLIFAFPFSTKKISHLWHGFIPLLLVTLFSLPAATQNVQQSGNATQGHPACFLANSIIYDCGLPSVTPYMLTSPIYTLTDSATVTPDLSLAMQFTWTLGATGRTLANPTNLTSVLAGQRIVLYIVQDGTGSRTITTWQSVYKFSGGTKPTLSTGAGAIDRVICEILSTTQLTCAWVGNFQ